MKKIYIVLMRTDTMFSTLINAVTRAEYTHSSISLDENLEYMFSFGRRYANNPFIGCFKREHMLDSFYGQRKNVPGIILGVDVTKEQYEVIKNIITEFILNGHTYNYNYEGIFTTFFKISNFDDKKYLCSEFVYHVLNLAEVIDFNITRNLVQPEDFLKIDGEIIYKGNLKKYNLEKDNDFIFNPLGNLI